MKIHRIKDFNRFSNLNGNSIIPTFYVVLTLLFSNAYLLQSQKVIVDSLTKRNDFVEKLDRRIIETNATSPVEKVYIHTDIVSVSETLWYSAYVVLGPYHRYSTASGVLFVDLIGPDNQIILSQTIKLTNGRGNGAVKIPEGLQSGNYHIRAYTSWMRNFDESFFYYQPIVIINNPCLYSPNYNHSEKINLQFFPEGGHLIEGLNSQVAFKATDGNGVSKLVTGRVEDSKGSRVAYIETMVEGLGLFYLKPKPKEQYTAILDDGSRYSLPRAMSRGYVISVNNKDENKIRVNVKATDNLNNDPFYVVGYIRGLKYLDGNFEFKGKSSIDFEIPKDSLPTGLMTITLFDAVGKSFCQRVVFNNNEEQLVINVKPVSEELKKRNPISLKIKVTDTNGKPISTSLSMAVTDASQISHDKCSNNILTQFYIQSELKGHIIDPWLFFMDKDRKTAVKLDLILMTHGWRKYKWSKVGNELSSNKEFKFSTGLAISGTAFGFNNKILANTNIKMIGQSKKEIFAHSTITDGAGKFAIEGINPIDSVRLLFNAYGNKKRRIDVKVKLNETKNMPLSTYNPYPKISSQKIEGYINGSVKSMRADSLFNLNNVTELDEVLVTAEKKKKNQFPSLYGIVPDATVYQDKNKPKDITFLLSSIPGVQVTGIGTLNPTINIRGVNSINSSTRPLILLDGMEITGGPFEGPFAYIDEFSIERIEVLKGSSTSLYGTRGSNGVILFYSRRGGETTNNPLHNISHYTLGYDAQKEFYSPNYDMQIEKHKTPDYRPTLYWNPLIVTDQNGEAEITFFNSDNANRIQIVINSLSNNGTAGVYFNTFGK